MQAPLRGRLVSWKPDKGFGFIRPDGGGKDVFVHVRDFGSLPRAPQVGDVIRFQTMRDRQGRLRAGDVQVEGMERGAKRAHQRSQSPSRNPGRSGPEARELNSSSWQMAVAAAFVCALVLLTAYGPLPVIVPPVYLLLSLVTLLLYAFDKSAAMNRRWRTNETTLLIAGLLGGWPGGLAAQGWLRHKSRKTAFLVPFWLTVVLNCAALYWVCTAAGAATIRRIVYSESELKIAVMGAGAVGSFFGALLHRAGHEVVLIGRLALVEAVHSKGLQLTMKEFDGFLPLQADTAPAAVRDAQLVLFCVKSGDTENAGAAIKPYLSDTCTVLCLQNGVDNAQRLTQVLQRQAVPVAVYVAVEMVGPGHVLHHGRCELILGPTPASDAVAVLLNQTGIPTTVTSRVHDVLWAKLSINCAYNALSALTQLSYSVLLQQYGMPATLRAIHEECLAVAAAAGIALPATLWEDTLAIGRTMSGQRSSTAHDVARGKRSEIDYINGYVVREGERLGIPTPVNRLLHTLVKVKDDAVPN
jgi:2-dehydropantoate 2-reductase